MPIVADAVDPASRTARRQADGALGEAAPAVVPGGGVDGVRLVVGGQVIVIKKVESDTELPLARPFSGAETLFNEEYDTHNDF